MIDCCQYMAIGIGYRLGVFRGFEEMEADHDNWGSANGGCSDKEFWAWFYDRVARKVEKEPERPTCPQGRIRYGKRAQMMIDARRKHLILTRLSLGAGDTN